MDSRNEDGKPPREFPVWAARVPQSKIKRLYDTDAKGIYDEELIDDVGYALLARCESFITANELMWGKLPCPRCSTMISHGRDKDEVLRCACGWELTWGEYFSTIQHQQLSGAEPVLRLFRDYVERFPKARTPREKMLLIDGLIHGFHIYIAMSAETTRPTAVNLIEGRMQEVIRLLDGLAYGPDSTPGTREAKAEWDRHAGNAPGRRRR